MKDMNTRSRSRTQPYWCTSIAEARPSMNINQHRRRLLMKAAANNV
jgi:hypothetical protein